MLCNIFQRLFQFHVVINSLKKCYLKKIQKDKRKIKLSITLFWRYNPGIKDNQNSSTYMKDWLPDLDTPPPKKKQANKKQRCQISERLQKGKLSERFCVKDDMQTLVFSMKIHKDATNACVCHVIRALENSYKKKRFWFIASYGTTNLNLFLMLDSLYATLKVSWNISLAFPDLMSFT